MKKLVRLTSALLAVALLSVLCAIPAAAADSSGTASAYVGYVNGSSYSLVSTGSSLSYSSMSEQSVTARAYAPYKIGLGSLDLDDDGLYYTGAVGIYFSYYYSFDFASIVASPGRPTTQYKNHLGNVGTGDNDVKSTTFTPVGITPGVSSGYSYGVSLSASYLGSEDAPISDLRIVGNANSCIGTLSGGGTKSGTLYVTSFRVVATETSADLEALEGIADALAAQSDILQAMYGDLVAICNSIYERTGDILETQQLANTYLSGIQSRLSTIRTTTNNIYTLLGTQFALLISAVETASTDIQGAISAQTAAIIAYLDALLDVTEVPGSISDATQQGDAIRNDLGTMDKPDLTAPDPSDFFTDADAQPFTDVLGNLFGSNLIVTLLLVSLSMAFVAYVLYGKE